MIVERKLTAEELTAILKVPFESARALAIKNDWRIDRDRKGRLRISVPDQFLKAQAGSPDAGRGGRTARAGAVSDLPAKGRTAASKAVPGTPAASSARSAQPAPTRRQAPKAKPSADRSAPESRADADLSVARTRPSAGPSVHASAGTAPAASESNRQDLFSLQVRVSSLESQIETLMKLAMLERQRAEEAITERNHWRALAERLMEALPDGNSRLRRWLQ